jgi:para-aminobenzoate synthetase/4-amino-4-deoxychorismate lyase
MKGTAPRGLWSLQDLARAAQLRRSAKTRAENLMIVDMVRNDLGRIAVPGSVRVSGLFAVEQYETVWQMTSTVEASTAARLPDILRALFPCASVTGAPKVRTMQIIAELEQSPRGIYTGCMGYLAPDGRAQFNVAIRTAHIDRELERAEYGVGGGILWGSSARREFDECLTKARVLGGGAPSFELLETLLWEPGSGYALLDGHLRRLGASARYFAFDVDAAAVKRRLLADAAAFPRRPRRVRLLVSRTGSVRLETQDCAAGTLTLHPPAARGPGAPAAWRVRLAPEPVRAEDRFLYHKTTRRDVYERARASCPDCDDVILWNASGEVTESTIANIVTRSRGRLLTPPVSAGLLPGVFRERLLRRRVIAEAPIVRADLARSEAVYLINSVRGWIPCRLDSPDEIQDQPRTRRNAT